MNTTGKLFTGMIGLVVIGVVLVGPMYIVDNWQVMEQTGSSVVPISQLFRTINNTGTIIEAFEQYNMENWIQHDNIFTTNSAYHSHINGAGFNSGGSLIYPAIDSINDDYDGYKDICTWPVAVNSDTQQQSYFVHFNALEALTNEVATIRIWVNVISGAYEYPWKIAGLRFGYCAGSPYYTISTTGASYLSESAFQTGERTFYVNLTTEQLNEIASFQGSYPSERCGFNLYLYFDGASGYIPSFLSSFECYQTYYVPSDEPLITDEYTNTTVYVGSDVTVSYYDIQQWILGLFGMGICVLALAASPFWNPVRDYAYQIGRSGKRKK